MTTPGFAENITVRLYALQGLIYSSNLYFIIIPPININKRYMTEKFWKACYIFLEKNIRISKEMPENAEKQALSEIGREIYKKLYVAGSHRMPVY